MAHIPDGVLSAPVLVGGGLMSAALLGIALKRLDYDRLPQAAVLSAAFFVSSLISVPLGPSSVHLLLNGLMGLLLGWTALPALFVALLLQAVFFGFGGLVALGVNTMNMALPALICALTLAPWMRRVAPGRRFWVGAAAGGLGVMATAALVAIDLGLSGEAFLPAAQILVLTYIPLAVVEALITGTVVAFLQRVAPEIIIHDEAGHA
ncbi:cobalt transporter CbiM [Imhoffiella purpurea]|uniref:Substrate-specific component NikM of nickel ECF transporter n=1 Tax=Imhoffiella purpurea TaxID=1249627 RepID=W9VDK6_9GAMM|nr:cobalt transporter CbiM [Imhoffiella purpurea]EXJ15071.1 Substrate-specific component NikM of nickel ECF transporter [Imhoffiella purpurea]